MQEELALRYANWSGETSILASIAGSLVGFVLVFFSIIYVQQPKPDRPYDQVHKKQLLIAITSVCWTALSSAILLAIASGAVPQQLNQFKTSLTIGNYEWFTTSAALGCMSFSVCLAQTFSCLVMLLSGTNQSKTVRFFSWFIILIVVLQSIGEIAATASLARSVKYGLNLVSAPFDMLLNTLKSTGLAFAVIALIRGLVHLKPLVAKSNRLATYVLSVDPIVLSCGSILFASACMCTASLLVCRDVAIDVASYCRVMWGLSVWVGCMLAFCLPYGVPASKYAEVGLNEQKSSTSAAEASITLEV